MDDTRADLPPVTDRLQPAGPLPSTAPPAFDPWAPPPWEGAAGLPPTGDPTRGPGSGQVWARRAGALGVVALVALGSGTAGALIADRSGPEAAGVTTASPVSIGSGTTPTETFAKVAAAVQPSVVSIEVAAGNGSNGGSGVILRSDGTILTNNHVIESAADGSGTIEVKFSNGRKAEASIVGRDPGTDLAVLKTTGVSGLTPATLASGDSLNVGDSVLAIGSPLGLEGSVTAGIVSALNRTVGLGDGPRGQASLSNAIQTDAAVNPGNSGGALVDTQGRVVGINTPIATLGSGGQSGSIGLGFAIPIDAAKSVADTLIAGGTVQQAVLGVRIADASGGGALINSVDPGSGAAAAGLAEGDIVSAIDGVEVTDGSSLAGAVRSYEPGEKVIVTFSRGGQTRTATVTLGSSAS